MTEFPPIETPRPHPSSPEPPRVYMVTRFQHRLLAVSVIVLALVCTFGAFKIIDNSEKTTGLVNTNRTLISEVAAAQASGRQNRVAAEERIRAEQTRDVENVRQLACIFVSQADPAVLSATDRRLLAQFWAKYQCPPFSKARARNPFAPLPSTRGPQSQSPARGTPTPTGGSSRPRASSTPSRPRTSASSSPSHPAPAPSTPPAPSSPRVCILHVCVTLPPL